MAKDSRRGQAVSPYEDWCKSFKQDVDTPSAGRAWKEIRRAGLEETALRILWAYKDLSQLRRLRSDLRSRASLAKATAREQGIAGSMRLYRQWEEMRLRWEQEGAPIQLLPREAPSLKAPEFFERRAQKKLAALRARMGSDGPAECQALALKVLSNDRGLLRPFLYLHMLRLRAAQCNVTLGAKRLAALAECANPEAAADPATIARYFRWLAKNFPTLGRNLFGRRSQPPPNR